VLVRAHAWLDRHPVAGDAALTAVLLAFSFSTMTTAEVDRGAGEVVCTFLLLLPLVLRRRAPTEVFALVMLACGVELLLAGGFLAANAGVLVALYTLVGHAPRRVATAGVGVALAGTVPFALHFHELSGPGGVLVVWGVLVVHIVLATVLGERLRVRAREREALEQRAVLIAADQAHREAAAAAAERGRIARELHDVVAHSLSVVIAQADGGRYAAARDPRAALAALETIARGGRAPRARPGGGRDRLSRRPGGADQRAQARGPGRGRRGHAALGAGGGDGRGGRRRHGGDRGPRRPGPRAGRDARPGRAARRHAAGRPTPGRRLRGPRDAARRARGSAPVSRATRVFLVDDQALVRAGFRLVIESQPDLTVVGEAGDGRAALAALAVTSADVVLMDVRMPALDGVEATAQLIARDGERAPRVVILTTFDLDEHVFSALRAGASGFMLKDAEPEELLAAIRAVASGDAVIAPSATRRLIAQVADRLPGAVEDPRIGELTEREREVLLAVARGASNAEIGGELFMAEATVKTHVGRLLAKLGARDRVQLVVFAYESGLVRAGG
jgi:DNA-binding NarL/FixJ family response regulator